MSFIVAIDGPAGTGKGTVTKILAEKFNLESVDTGAMYRCVALQIIKENVELKNIEKIQKILNTIKIEFKKNEKGEEIYLNGENVTTQIREKPVNDLVSTVARIKEVKIAMAELQRKAAVGKNVIMEGRDMTTRVFPNADVKIYLDANEKIRAERRYKQDQESGKNTTYEEALKNVRLRDELDKSNPVGGLKIAEDAVIVDSSYLTIDEVAQKISEIIRSKLND